MIFLAVIFPPIYFLFTGNIIRALISVFLCATGVGWIFASLWAVMYRSNAITKKEADKKKWDERKEKVEEKAEKFKERIEKWDESVKKWGENRNEKIFRGSWLEKFYVKFFGVKIASFFLRYDVEADNKVEPENSAKPKE